MISYSGYVGEVTSANNVKVALLYLSKNKKEQSNPGATPGLFFSRTRHYQSYFNAPYRYGRKEFHYVFCRW